jgi:hypothetical protein
MTIPTRTGTAKMLAQPSALAMRARGTQGSLLGDGAGSGLLGPAASRGRVTNPHHALPVVALISEIGGGNQR